MNNLICRLLAIKEFCKDIHYSVYGLEAISLHKFADEVQENINDYIDELKEVCLLGNNFKPLASKEYMQQAILLIPDCPKDNKEKFEVLKGLIGVTLDNLPKTETTKEAVNSILDKIAEDLQKSVGLINLIIE